MNNYRERLVKSVTQLSHPAMTRDLAYENSLSFFNPERGPQLCSNPFNSKKQIPPLHSAPQHATWCKATIRFRSFSGTIHYMVWAISHSTALPSIQAEINILRSPSTTPCMDLDQQTMTIFSSVKHAHTFPQIKSSSAPYQTNFQTTILSQNKNALVAFLLWLHMHLFEPYPQKNVIWILHSH